MCKFCVVYISLMCFSLPYIFVGHFYAYSSFLFFLLLPNSWMIEVYSKKRSFSLPSSRLQMHKGTNADGVRNVLRSTEPIFMLFEFNKIISIDTMFRYKYNSILIFIWNAHAQRWVSAIGLFKFNYLYYFRVSFYVAPTVKRYVSLSRL